MSLIFNKVKRRLIEIARKNDHFSRVKYHLYYGIHNRLLRGKNEEFESVVHGAKMIFPPEHVLPVLVASYPLQETPIIEIAGSIKKRSGKLNYIDVGANIGDTILIIDNAVEIDNVLAIEGSAKFASYLTRNLAAVEKHSKVSIEKTYLSDKVESVRVKKHDEYGTNFLETDETAEVEQFVSLDELINTKYNPVEWNLLKLDTDGFDYMIMRGASKLLGRKDLSIFFEFDPTTYERRKEDPLEMFAYLRDHGFTSVTFYNNIGEKMISSSISDLNVITQMISYNLRYRRFHFDVLAVKD